MSSPPRIVTTIKTILSNINFDLVGYHLKVDLFIALMPTRANMPSLEELRVWEAEMGRVAARLRILAIILYSIPFFPFWFVWMTFFNRELYGTDTYVTKYNRLLGRPLEHRHVTEVSAQFWMYVESRRRAIGRAVGDLVRFDAIPYVDQDGQWMVARMEIRQDTEWRDIPYDESASTSEMMKEYGDEPANPGAENGAVSAIATPEGKKVIELTESEVDDLNLQAEDRYMLWWQAYEELLQKEGKKDMSRRWASLEIAKLPIGKNYTEKGKRYTAGYIYRHMHK